MGAQDQQERTFFFESRYPALQIHLGEKVEKLDEDRKIRTLDEVVFSPEVGLATGTSPKKGFFSTKDQALAHKLRQHKNFKKTFIEITKA